MLHRLIPSDPSPPIAALSPSEFGFEFVAHALVTRPWTTAGYLALTGVGVYHAFVGGQKVMRWARALVGSAKQSSPAAASTTSWGGVRAAIGAVLAAVGLGLYRLAQDGDAISTVVVRRFDAVFAAAPWTAIGLE